MSDEEWAPKKPKKPNIRKLPLSAMPPPEHARRKIFPEGMRLLNFSDLTDENEGEARSSISRGTSPAPEPPPETCRRPIDESRFVMRGSDILEPSPRLGPARRDGHSEINLEREPLPPCPGPGYAWCMFGGKPAGWRKDEPMEPPPTCRRPIDDIEPDPFLTMTPDDW